MDLAWAKKNPRVPEEEAEAMLLVTNNQNICFVNTELNPVGPHLGTEFLGEVGSNVKTSCYASPIPVHSFSKKIVSTVTEIEIILKWLLQETFAETLADI